ncbi:MAG: stage II sporulation protein D [Clostridia bacterium]|nr:stage II sporulation protein D [Clostridia bacterium]
MKNSYLVIAIVLCLGMLLLPLIATTDTTTPLSELSPTPLAPTQDVFLVLDDKTDEIITLSAKDYITGVVCAEMSASFSPEALKAQTVAAYTYASYKRYMRQNSSDPTEYDVTTSIGTDQAYISEEAAKEKYGEKYEQYISPIKQAVEQVLGEILTYNGAPALTVYHSVSSSNTNSAKDVWGQDYPYLQSVASKLDLMSENYASEVTLSAQEVETALKDLCESDGDYANWFKDIVTSPSGLVLSCNVAGKSIKGTDIRKALGLKSATFYVSFSDDTFTFSVYGYGHGVGMSQYGANCMALKGYTYKEILDHYYPGCTLKNK